MGRPILVFLDTSVHKHGIRSRVVTRRRDGAVASQILEEDPVAVRGVPRELRAEIDLLEQVAHLARGGAVGLVTHVEALWELAGILRLGRMTSVFDGIAVERLANPVGYSRFLTPFAGSAATPRDLTLAFLQELRHPRYMELRRACGAYQGARPSPPNQLLDAFLLWCADAASVPYLLTTDLNLMKTVRACKSVKRTTTVVSPSELLRALRPSA